MLTGNTRAWAHHLAMVLKNAVVTLSGFIIQRFIVMGLGMSPGRSAYFVGQHPYFTIAGIYVMELLNRSSKALTYWPDTVKNNGEGRGEAPVHYNTGVQHNIVDMHAYCVYLGMLPIQ